MTNECRIGEVTIHALVEMIMPVRPIREFFPNLDDEVLSSNRHWLQPDSLDAADRIVLCFQSHIIRTPHHTILVDTCIGNDKTLPGQQRWNRKQDDTWATGLAAAGLRIEDIDYVMCTHLHADHVGWNTRLQNGRWAPTFPNARYLFSATELAYVSNLHAQTPLPYMEESVLPVVVAGQADLVSSDHALGDHLRLLSTPGHTIDHFAVEIGRGRADAVITGDLIHSPLQAKHPELQMYIDHDPAQAVATRRSFLERFCDTGTVCCFSHFPLPSNGRVKRWENGFRCEYV